MSIQLLVTHKLPSDTETALGERYTLHKLYEIDDRAAFLAQKGEEIRAIAGGHAPASLIENLPALELIAGFGVGYDRIDTEAARAAGIKVTNTPDVLNDAVAELTIGLMIDLARKITLADRFVRDGEWAQRKPFPLQSELTGKTVGIFGLGRIGKEIAMRCAAMRMRVVYHGRHKQANQPYVYYSDLTDMARDVDWLVIMAPGGDDTKGVVSREVLEALGEKGYLVNMARGTLVDETALVEKLENRQIAGAALDVFENEPNVPEALFALDNVVLSPHAGSATCQTRNAMGEMLIANLDAWFAGKPLLSQVV